MSDIFKISYFECYIYTYIYTYFVFLRFIIFFLLYFFRYNLFYIYHNFIFIITIVCFKGKIVNAAEDALPTGWSLQKKAYVEMFEADKSKPLLENIVIIPNLVSVRQFTTFWRQVCENAGAVVLIADNLGISFFFFLLHCILSLLPKL